MVSGATLNRSVHGWPLFFPVLSRMIIVRSTNKTFEKDFEMVRQLRLLAAFFLAYVLGGFVFQFLVGLVA